MNICIIYLHTCRQLRIYINIKYEHVLYPKYIHKHCTHMSHDNNDDKLPRYFYDYS